MPAGIANCLFRTSCAIGILGAICATTARTASTGESNASRCLDALRGSSTDSAVETCSWTLESDREPGSKNAARVVLKRGEQYAANKNYEKAIAYFNEAIRLSPKFAAAYGKRGSVYLAMMDYDLAVADFSEAIVLAPKLTWPYVARGVV